jgi:hypothetical protein
MSTLSDSLGAAVECDGFLHKRGEFGLQLYRRRYFMLRDEDLFYMTDDSLQSKLNPLGKIDLRSVHDVQSLLHAPTLFGAAQCHLYLKTPRRIFDLMSPDRAVVARFVEAIQQVRANIARRDADALADASTSSNALSASDPAKAIASSWRFGVEPDAASLLPAPPNLAPVPSDTDNSSSSNNGKLNVPRPDSPSAQVRRRSSTQHVYEAVPAEVLRVFQFTEGFGLDQFLSLLEPPVKDALAYASKCGYSPAHAAVFAAALIVRALGSDVLQFNDAVPRTAPLAVNVAREYAMVHDGLLDYLRERAPLLERDTKLLDRWVLTTRQPVLFGPAATQLPLAALDRIGLQRWHLLALCRFASAHFEPLRHQESDAALSSTLYAWDLMVDRLLGELTRLPMTAVGTHLWHVLTESDQYQRDAADNGGATNTSESPTTTAAGDDNPYEAQLRRARSRVSSLVQDAIATRLPRCDDATQDAIQRLLHAELLMQQLVNECETLGLFDSLPRLLKLFNDANVELSRVIDELLPLKPYRALLREQRTKLIAAWWQSASACGGSSLLLERVAESSPSAPSVSPSRGAAVPRKWHDVLVRCTALLKRIASLVDSRQFGAARDVVLLCAIKVQEQLPEVTHFQLGPITFH